MGYLLSSSFLMPLQRFFKNTQSSTPGILYKRSFISEDLEFFICYKKIKFTSTYLKL